MEGDPEGFDQALVHLVQNAIDASDTNSSVMLEVYSDGMSGKVDRDRQRPRHEPAIHSQQPVQAVRVFEGGGFGIGAFEARELIRSMGGRLDVESREGMGTRFTISLPMQAAHSLIGRSNSAEKTRSHNGGNKPKLLIIEDDEGLQAQLKWAYEDFDVVMAGTRDTALAALRSEEPAVVTLDLGLPPDPDGDDRGLRRARRNHGDEARYQGDRRLGPRRARKRAAAVEAGAYDFYQKPVDIDTLGLIVQRAYRLHQIESENRRLADKVGEERTVLGSMITAAPEMAKVARTIERVAPTNVSVMLLGASGTGKELLARGVHDLSDRATALRRDQLRGNPGKPARKRAVRAREGRLYRRGEDDRGQDRTGRWRHAVPRRSGRYSACPCRSNCCASCRSARSSASVVARRFRSIRGSSARRIRTSKR